MRTYPRYIGLLPGILVRVDSAEEEARLRRSEALCLLWGVGLGVLFGVAAVVAVLVYA